MIDLWIATILVVTPLVMGATFLLAAAQVPAAGCSATPGRARP